MVDDAIALGVQHAALNWNLAQMIDLAGETNSFPLEIGTNRFHFRRGYIEAMDGQIKTLSDTGAVVSLILLYYRSGQKEMDAIMLHPKFSDSAPNGLTEFNTSTPEGGRWLQACFEFIARRYSEAGYPHGRVANYIVGNEVNSHWFWANMGRTTMEEFATDYLRAVRLCDESVKKYSTTARVYLSLEHHWNIHYPGGDEAQTFAARPFLEFFARRAREGGDFDWNLAYHPYPENLFECRTWNDKTATFEETTPRITFKNLEMLTKFFEREDLRYHGQLRRIILSEQGFHSKAGEEGERAQAAAYAYAFYRVSKLPGIDAFILHRHVDHGQEGGLNLGLWARKADSVATPDRKKPIYDVFRRADTPDWQEAFSFALPIIGIKSWSEIDPK